MSVTHQTSSSSNLETFNSFSTVFNEYRWQFCCVCWCKMLGSFLCVYIMLGGLCGERDGLKERGNIRIPRFADRISESLTERFFLPPHTRTSWSTIRSVLLAYQVPNLIKGTPVVFSTFNQYDLNFSILCLVSSSCCSLSICSRFNS